MVLLPDAICTLKFILESFHRFGLGDRKQMKPFKGYAIIIILYHNNWAITLFCSKTYVNTIADFMF